MDVLGAVRTLEAKRGQGAQVALSLEVRIMGPGAEAKVVKDLNQDIVTKQEIEVEAVAL